MSETPVEREARLLAETREELTVEARHIFQDSLTAKPEISAPDTFARILYRLGFQTKLPVVDAVVNEIVSDPTNG
jgi:hypothetical protein